MWLDLERTCEEIARFSGPTPRPTGGCSPSTTRSRTCSRASASRRSGSGPSFDEMLDGRPGGAALAAPRAMSAWDVMRHEFESRHVQAFMLWMAFQTRAAGRLGRLRASSPTRSCSGASAVSWTLPRGGSGELTDALVEVHRGAAAVRCVCGQRVTRLVLAAAAAPASRRRTASATSRGEAVAVDDPRQGPGARWRPPTRGTRTSSTASTRTTSGVSAFAGASTRRPSRPAIRCRTAGS